MQVKLKVTKLVDTPQERTLLFELVATDSGKSVFSTKSTEKRDGVRSWSQAQIYTARSRVKSWIKRHSATLVG